MGTQSTDFAAVAIGGYQDGVPLSLEAGQSATWSLIGDITATCVVYLERSDNFIHWDVIQTFAAGAVSETGTVSGKYAYRFRLKAGATAQDDTLDAEIADVDTDLADPLSAEADAVITTAATSTVPFGYSEAQANALVASLNAVIARQNGIVEKLIAKGILPE